MKLISKLYKSVSQKNFILFSLSIIFIMALRIPFEILFSNTIVKYALSYISSIWYNDFAFLLICVFLVLLTIKRFKRYTPSNNLTAILVILSLIYILYRITGTTWDFKSLKFIPFLKYADLLVIISIFQLFLFIPNKVTKSENLRNSFFDDEPLGETGTDELGYGSYAELLSHKILSSHFNKAFAIGINGKWGIGKTSFIDILRRNVTDESIIEIIFNPWNSNSPKAIIKDFFETVQESIRPYHSSLSRLLIQYSDKLVTLRNNTVTQSVQSTVSAITGFESINSLYQEINSSLVRINKKIVVYIDDLDRLDKDEIIEVIRLIRNTANFHNTFFIVAYDRNYVINALKQHNPYKQEEFLEKIFQIEVTLPYFKKDILRNKLSRKLKEKLPESLHLTIEKEVIGTVSSVPVFLNEWLESIRDVTRLANALVLNLTKLNGEVDFNDLMRIELLRLKFPSIYELLFRKTSEFLETSSGHSNKEFHYILKNLSEEEKKSLNQEEKTITKNLELYLRRNRVDLSIPEKDITRIVDFIDGIFGGALTYTFYGRSHLSIIFPGKFNRYFAYNLLEGNLSEIEFSKARSLSQVQFNSKITEWLKAGLENELKNRFSEINSFDSRDDFEKVIRAIFHLANYPSKRYGYDSWNLVGFNGEDLHNKMSNYAGKLSDKLYGKANPEELKTFIRSIFEGAKSPYSFEAEFLSYLSGQLSDTFPITKDEIKEFTFEYLKKYCSEVDMLDSNVWNLFQCCKQTEWIPAGGNSYSKKEAFTEESKTLMKDFLLNKDLDGFLLSIIATKAFVQDLFAISSFVIEIFDNWKAFEEELSKKDEEKSKYLNEFRALLAKFAGTNYSQYVSFKFQTIPFGERLSK